MPAALRLVRGARKDRGNPDEPLVEIRAPDAPEFLSDDAREVFIVTAHRLARMRVMSENDVDALAIYAESFVRWKAATRNVQETGQVVRSPKGYPIQNPYLSIANKAQEQCLKILVEFGLTPSSRTRVNRS